MLIVDKQAGAAGSLITEPPIIKMQLILILPLVPSHFVLEISRAGQSRDHRHRASSPFFTSNPISIFFTPVHSWPISPPPPPPFHLRRTRRKLKRWRALMFLFFFPSFWSESSQDRFQRLCQLTTNERCDVSGLLHNYQQSSIIGQCVLSVNNLD